MAYSYEKLLKNVAIKKPSLKTKVEELRSAGNSASSTSEENNIVAVKPNGVTIARPTTTSYAATEGTSYTRRDNSTVSTTDTPKTASNHRSRWYDDDYTLTDSERKEARQLVDSYYNSHPVLTRGTNSEKYDYVSHMSPTEAKRFNDIDKLNKKLNIIPTLEAPQKTDDEIIAEYEGLKRNGGSAAAGREYLAQKNAKYDEYTAALERKGEQLYNALGGNNTWSVGNVFQKFAYENKLSDDDVKAIQAYMKAKDSKQTVEALSNYADEHKIAGTALSVPLNAFGSAANVARNVKDFATGTPMRTDEALRSAQHMRNAVSDDMGKTGQFLYGAGTSILDMGAALGLAMLTGGGSAVSGGLLGVEKASDVMAEASKRGLSNNQVLAEGIASGLTTYLTEKIPMGKLENIAQTGFSGTGKELAKNILKSVGGSALSEGGQEALENLADTAADILIAKDKSEFAYEYNNLLNQGYDKFDAALKVLGDKALEVLTDAAAGALSGGSLAIAGGSVGRAVSNIKDNINASNQTVMTQDMSKPQAKPQVVEPNLSSYIPQVEAPTETVNVAKENSIPAVEEVKPVVAEKTSAIPNDVNDKLESFRELLPEADKRKIDNIKIALEKYYSTGKLFNVQAAYNLATRNMEYNAASSELGLYLADLITEATSDPNSPYATMTTEDSTQNTAIPKVEENVQVEAPKSNKVMAEDVGLENKPTNKVTSKTLDKAINDLTNMFARGENVKEMRSELKAAINEYESTHSEEAYNKVASLLEQFENIMRGNTYTTQRSKNKNQSGKLKTYSYPTNYGILTENVMSEVDSMKAAFERENNSNKNNNSLLANELSQATSEFAKLTSDEKAWRMFNIVKDDINNALTNPNDTASDFLIDDAQKLMDMVPESESLVNKMLDDWSRALKNVTAQPERANTGNVSTTNDDTVAETSYNFDEIDNTYTTDKKKVSQTAQNSYAKTAFFGQNEETLKLLTDNNLKGENSVDIKRWKDTNARAVEMLDEYGSEKIMDDILYKDPVDALQVCESAYLMDEMLRNKEYDKVTMFAGRMVQKIHDAAQALNMLAQYSRTAAGTIGQTETIAQHDTDRFVKKANKSRKGKAQIQQNSEFAKALSDLGNDSLKEKNKKPATKKTYEQIVAGVEKALNLESSSINDKLSEHVNAIAKLIESGVGTKDLTSELERLFKDGAFYTLDESIPILQKGSNEIANALLKLNEGDIPVVEKAPKTFKELVAEIKKTVSDEYSSIGDFSDTEIEMLAHMIEGGYTTEDITNALNRKLATGSLGMSNEDMQQIVELFEGIESGFLTSKEEANTLEQVYAIASKYVGNATFMDKWNAWRYMAMLGNLKTMKRNIEGNSMFGTVTQAKDNIAALMEAAYSKTQMGKDMKRTKSVLNLTAAADVELLQNTREDFDNNAYMVATDTGNKYSMKRGVESAKQIFQNKYLEKARTGISEILDKSDTFALKNKYGKSLAMYLKANGKNESIFTSTDEADIKLLDEARKYAIQQAKIATFHEDNRFSDWLAQASKTARDWGNLGGDALSMLIESTFPFKKTPANILKQGIQYSPVSILKAIGDIKTQEEANVVIDDLAKGLTGSALFGLGAYLFSKGMLRSQADDKDDPYGKGSDFSLIAKGKSYTIDWLAPASLPLFTGAEFAKIWEQRNEDVESSVIDALFSITEPVVEMSMLQGLKNVLSTTSSWIKKNEVATPLTTMAAGYVSQVIPTLAGQVARSIDDTRRSTSIETSSTNNPVLAVLEKSVKKAINKIPGLSMTNQPYVDIWGEETKNEGFFSALFGTENNVADRLVYNMLSSGYINDLNLSDREQGLLELEEIYKENKGNKGSLIPTSASRSPGDERLSDKDYTAYAKAKGQELAKAVDVALERRGKEIDDDILAKATKNIEAFSNIVAEEKSLGYEHSDSYKKAFEAFGENEDYNAVMDYYVKSALLNKYGLSDSEKVSELYAEKGEEGLKEYSEQKSTFDDLGLSMSNKTANELYADNDTAGLESYAEKYNAFKEYGVDIDNKYANELYSKRGKSGLNEFVNVRNKLQKYGFGMDNEKARSVLESGGETALQKYAVQETAFENAGVSHSKYADEAYNAGGEKGLKEYADTKRTLENYGLEYNEKNAALYKEKGVTGLRVQKSINDMDSKAGTNMIPVLDGYSSLSAKDKGEYIISNTNTKLTTEYAEDPEFVYEVYKLALSDIPDMNGDKKVNKKDYEKYLPTLGYSKEETDTIVPYLVNLR